MANDTKITVRHIVDAIGREKLAKELGLENAKSIQPAVTNNIMPASWYYVVTKLGADHGITVPQCSFKFKQKCESQHHTAA